MTSDRPFLPMRFPLCRFWAVLALCFSLPVSAFSMPVTASDSVERKTELFEISASWPVVGIARVDEESKAFVVGLADSFAAQAEELAAELKATEEDFKPSDMPTMFPCELSVTHEVTWPSERVVSLVWNIWSYTGGAHGQLEIVAGNYDRNTGFPLLLEDLFLDPQLAVVQFSRIARHELANPDEDTGEENVVDDMLRAGTEPVEENFQTFSLLPDGIRIFFQPYQVAPWAAGPQTVDISLKALQGAKPRLEFWQQAD